MKYLNLSTELIDSIALELSLPVPSLDKGGELSGKPATYPCKKQPLIKQQQTANMTRNRKDAYGKRQPQCTLSIGTWNVLS